jgi:hypothetical protein
LTVIIPKDSFKIKNEKPVVSVVASGKIKFCVEVPVNLVIDGEIADNSRVEKLHTLGKGVFVSK